MAKKTTQNTKTTQLQQTTVGTYLQQLRDLVSNTVNTATSNAIKNTQQASVAQLLELIGTAKSLKGDKNRPEEVTPEMLKSISRLDKLVEKMLKGQTLTDTQQQKLSKVSTDFYTAIKGYAVNTDKLIKNIEKTLNKDLPDAISNRLNIDIKRLSQKSKDNKSVVVADEEDAKQKTSSFKLLKDIATDLAKGNKLTAIFRSKFGSAFENFTYKMGTWFSDLKNWASDHSTLLGDLFKLGVIFLGTGIVQKLFKNLFEKIPLFSIVSSLIKFGPLVKEWMKGSETVSKFTEKIAGFFGKIAEFAKGIAKLATPLKGMFRVFAAVSTGGISEVLRLVMKVIPAIFKPLSYIFRFGSKAFAPLAIITSIIDAIRGWNADKTASTIDRIFNALDEVLKGFTFGLVSFTGIVTEIERLVNFMKGKGHKTDAEIAAEQAEKDRKTQEKWKSKNVTISSGKKPTFLSAFGSKKTTENGAGESTVDFGHKLASIADRRKHGVGGKMSLGKCGKYVGNALAEAVTGDSRKTVVRGNGKDFAKGLMSPTGKKYFDFSGHRGNGQFGNLPAGSILSWPASPGHKWGHVEIADGKGHLISDFSRGVNSILYRNMQPGLKASVFTPKGVSVPAASEDTSNTIASADTNGTDFSSAADDTANTDFLTAFKALMTAGQESGAANAINPTVVKVDAGIPISTTTPSQITAKSNAAMITQSVNNLSAKTESTLPKLIAPVSNSNSQAVRKTEIDDAELLMLQSVLLS